MIKKSHRVFNEEEKKLYRVMDFACRNKKCTEFDKTIGTQKDELSFDFDD